MYSKFNARGFGLTAVLVVILVLVVVGGAGFYVWERQGNTGNSNSQTGSNTTPQPEPQADPYKGWKEYCDSTTSSCIKHPSDWTSVANTQGAFENSMNTAYVSLRAGTNKDRSEDTAYIYSVDTLNTSATPLDIVGLVVNDKPTYMVYNDSYISANKIKAGGTVQVIYGNYAFDGKSGTISLVGTPGAAGYAAITSADQAKAWFTSQEARTDLLVLKSFRYQ